MSALISSLPVLILYPHARCNCRCVMCDIWKDTAQSEITAEELTRHLTDIEKLSVKSVVFSGGEPLMHSDLFRLADMLRSRGIRLTLLSTGLLLKRHAAQIATRIDDVIVSLDGPPHVHDQIRRVPHAFSQLEQGLRAIHGISPEFPISARCTIQKSNFSSLGDTVRVAKALGLKSISFLAADLTSEAFNRIQPWAQRRQAEIGLTLDEIATLEKEFEAINRDWQGSGFVAESSEKLGRIAQHFRAELGLCQPEAPRCNAPWVSTVVEANGTVRPCFFHRPIGSLKSHSLFEVVNGFEAQQFRASLDVESNPVCKRCVCSLNWREPASPNLYNSRDTLCSISN